MVQEQLDGVLRRIGRACERAGRPADAVSILAVTKKVAPEQIQEAAECGLRVFGESRVQEAKQKIPLCASHLEWHLVGHLQTNKVRDAAGLFRAIHSVDSLRLLTAIDGACAASGTTMRVLIEVNNSGEGTKFGVKPEAVSGLLGAARGMMNVDVSGLMTIPPASRDPEDARPFFRNLRELRNRLRRETGFALDELSMGMSDDFEVAVEEGATWVRLGRTLFGERQARGEKSEQAQDSELV